MTAIRKHVKDFVAIIVLFLLAVVTALYVLHHERLRFPWEATP